MLLVTTAIPETWGCSEKILALGEWCIPFSQSNIWSARNYRVMPYHWSNREKLQANHDYLQKVYEQTLSDLSFKLNEIHRVEYDINFWRILVGPWLLFFIEIFFDRWSSIHKVVKENEVKETISISFDPNSMVPNDMSDFIRLMIGDSWNHFIFTYLIQEYTSIPIKYIDLDSKLSQPICKKKSMQYRLKQISIFSINKIFTILAKNSDIFIISPYLSATRLLALYIKLYQFTA